MKNPKSLSFFQVIYFVFSCISAVLILSVSASDLGTSLGKKDQVQANLVAEINTVKPGTYFWAAVHLTMKPKWHTYWKNPGDAGLATNIHWELPDGFSASEIYWPYPERFSDSGIISHGYKDQVYLLSKIRVDKSVQPNQKVQLKAKVNWLACKEICIPGSADLVLNLPSSETSPGPNAELAKEFADTRFRFPLTETEWGFKAFLANKRVLLVAHPPTDYPLDSNPISFFPDTTFPLNLNSEQKWVMKDKELRVYFDFAETEQEIPQRLQGVLVNSIGWRGANTEKAIRIDIPLSTSLPLESKAIGISNEGETRILVVLLFAFLGGLILNLMPCVFPVISLKVLGFVNQAHSEGASPVKHALVFSFGILLSFWILGGALLILRAGGEKVGWGFQLQSPYFIIFLAILLFLLALNLFGIFEVGLGLTRTGSLVLGKSGWVESFLSGVLATVVATPCTAPYMGTALAFSLSQPPLVSMGVFTALGVGMASPYVLLSKFQRLIDLIPRPGMWMEKFKQFMGFLLLGTVIWLLWVLNIQAGPVALFGLIASLLVLGMSTWIYGSWATIRKKGLFSGMVVSTAIVLFLLGCIGPYLLVSNNNPGGSLKKGDSNSLKNTGINWETFSPEKVTRLRSEGKPIFIDFTAAWCLSCLANERIAFSSEKVKRRFEELEIVPLKADWTNKNEEIANELAKFGRNGVPLYVLFDRNPKTEPMILPQILTPGIVLDALDSLEN